MRSRFLVAPFLLLLAACATTQPAPDIDPAELNGDQLWTRLLEDNQSYVSGRIAYNDLVNDRARTAPKQNPPVTILSCADSRVPPELAFHRTVGDLFVAREAGNVADEFTIASIEYAILNRYTRLIVVLGHEDCGAVVAAIENKQPPYTDAIGALVERIRKSFPDNHCPLPEWVTCVKHSVELNTTASAKYLITESQTIRDAVCRRPPPQQIPAVSMVTAYYNLVSGRVEAIPFDVTEACRAAGIE